MNSQSKSIKNYNPSLIEKKWQKIWTEKELYKTNCNVDKNNKFYALSMFPYPSGNLHMGHVRNYVITDLIARYQTFKGKEVLHPMGWDAFGLPAENAAIERGINPQDWTRKNISHMRQQLKLLGLSIDWDKEFATCDENYYKWTQFLFLELYESGLIYQKESQVNWDPIDNTVLANEQVDSEGRSWRSGALVEKKYLKQWYLKITSYAEELIDELIGLQHWPEKVKIMQENWIGKSIGAYINFKIKDINDLDIKVYTTRPDTLFGVTYLAISCNHILTKKIKDPKIISFIKELNKKKKEDKRDNIPKIGIDTNYKAINPITLEEIPIWIANYVLDDYGTGSVMGVPAHDNRDFEFASIHNINIKVVIEKEKHSKSIKPTKAYEESGYLINSNHYNGLKNSHAKDEIIKQAEEEGWGQKAIQYRLRDWLISRQRYWGCPIPMVNCDNCGTVPLNKKDLPVKLPKKIEITSNKINSLKNNSNWIKVKCPKCGQLSMRETDTMDTFMCSSWYFLRFPSKQTDEKPFEKDLIDTWLPVDQYVGGIEHAILHLLYARFLTKALRDNNLFSVKEPFERLLTQGMVQAPAYKNIRTGKYISPNDIEDLTKPTDPNDQSELQILFEKMSKSKYNGIDPETVISRYGADTARMFILFKAPPEKDLEWGESDVEGQFRFLSKIWKLYKEINLKEIIVDGSNNSKEKILLRSMNIAIKEITHDIDRNQFNTAISELMKFYNSIIQEIEHVDNKTKVEVLQIFCILLSPFAPHLSEEIWGFLGNSTSVHKESWPEIDSNLLKNDEYELVVQINGKVRDKLYIPTETSEIRIKEIVIKRDNVKKWIDNKEIKKVIVVKGRIINIVV
mgnify:CR=1 FL=1